MDDPVICVIGGGIVGLTFAALHQKNGGNVFVLDKQPRHYSSAPSSDETQDGKSVVISAKSLALLESTGITIKSKCPISHVNINFQDALGEMNINGDLGAGVCHTAIKQQLIKLLNSHICAPAVVNAINTNTDGVLINYTAEDKDKSIQVACLVVACDLPLLPSNFIARRLDYQQAAISFFVRSDNFPAGYAAEQFTQDGIIALVPRTDGNVGVIICASQNKASDLLTLEEEQLMDKINGYWGGRFNLQSPSARFVYAPQARHVSPLAADAIVCIGAGAMALHPVGAQSFNIGLGDARCLAQILKEYSDINIALSAYCRRRAYRHYGALALTSMASSAGHLRQLPFRIIGGAGASVLSAIIKPAMKKYSL